jgi:valyl-tRNA synthetase
MTEEFESRYDIQEVESRIYELWDKSGFFNPDICIDKGVTHPDAEPFSIVLPPPNVTGELHMGHAAMLVIEDILVRFNRMRGKRTLWVPGTDHAAIATQSRVEKNIYDEEKKRRHDLGREEFLRRVNEFTEKSREIIIKQIKRMGSSLDWSREAYTLDEKRERAVRMAFKKMYDLGLVYRGNRVVNWDSELGTTVSDDEIEWIEETVPLYYLKYGPFTITTARPETKFGDKYVVMHPNDRRYEKYKHGDKINLEWINGQVTATIIKDSSIDMEFGTGVMTITPWHDIIDFGIAERHELDMEQIIDLQGKLLPVAGEFVGLHIKKARPLIVEKLKAKNLIDKIDEKYEHRIATDSRGGSIIEPQILKQWFVDVNKTVKGNALKDLMRHAVEKGEIEILPEHFTKTYFHWIDNLRDWCISRQIWFGHQIPVWYRGEEIYCGTEAPQGDDWEQDTDTLDTWFSSGLWPFSTLGWPNKTKDLETYFPNSVLETGYDILFFWVARMILMSTVIMDDIPFRKVYLHGLVRDTKGRKMSKSLNNGIDPLEMADKYGADATRLSLVIGASAGNDIKLSEDRIRGYRNFATKIWNAARFVLMNKSETEPQSIELSPERLAYLEEFSIIKKEITAHIEAFEFHLASEKAYHYFWHTFADKIIEAEKDTLKSSDETQKQQAYSVLKQILVESLKMLHPFMPFVTEEIYQKVNPGHILMVERW